MRSINRRAVFRIVLVTAATVSSARNLVCRPFDDCLGITPDTNGSIAGYQREHDREKQEDFHGEILPNETMK
jgi:hypothetical protein